MTCFLFGAMVISPLMVMEEFYKVRLEFYDRRKVHLTNKLTEEWEKLDNKVHFLVQFINRIMNLKNVLVIIRCASSWQLSKGT